MIRRVATTSRVRTVSDYTVYLDDQHRIVPLSDATYVVNTTTDDTGRVIAEEWQQTLPRPPAPEHRKAIWDAAWSAALASLRDSSQPWVLAAAGGLLLLVLSLLAELAGATPIALLLGLLGLGLGFFSVLKLYYGQ